MARRLAVGAAYEAGPRRDGDGRGHRSPQPRPAPPPARPLAKPSWMRTRAARIGDAPGPSVRKFGAIGATRSGIFGPPIESRTGKGAAVGRRGPAAGRHERRPVRPCGHAARRRAAVPPPERPRPCRGSSCRRCHRGDGIRRRSPRQSGQGPRGRAASERRERDRRGREPRVPEPDRGRARAPRDCAGHRRRARPRPRAAGSRPAEGARKRRP